MDTRFYPLRVRAVEPDTDEAMIVSFDVPDDLADRFAFTQGQYLNLRATIDGAEVRRSYSVCAGVDDAVLRIGVRKVRGGVFSNWIAENLHEGDTIDIMPPQGRFYVPINPEEKRHYLAIAGGSGITPVLSILKTVLGREPQSRFTLIYGNRSLRSTMFKEELEDLKNRYLSRLEIHHVFSEENAQSPLHHGLLDRERIGQFLSLAIRPQTIDHAFVCGPHLMNDGAEAALLAANVASERIHIERFNLPQGKPEAGAAMHEIQSRDAAHSRVMIVRDGQRREIEVRKGDPSVLDVAIAAGMDLPFSCTSGVCGTCRARLLCGEVRMDRNFALEKADVDAGFILTCQSHPLTEQVEISFDDR
ncbi:subunit of the phenylacetly-CoA oxygenase/reductase [Thiomonas arsenitoxydans]|jgi:ring-1,2-phenylacetyl-CoA epoxidase subunit PaaE|uniref:Phenylacetate-CoA oxygenase/reductase subunit PaaE n=2 Tax=Thiomonas TaxID=32012 RepID=D6CNK7_THIA3|nr:1,2-phenylacetyl-CoA epoxidase subunit PaaE [Thiomonas arsenitoxydans]MDE2253417.1 phenylacetate-CoA oxygenase/reductase subunit PaaK [Betaproteobacteria bacterium]OZB77220.1 MAG: phenylacetic acid degradation protein [Thiomonas sp. 14-64-326]CAZ90135.1 Phenylacetate-CoA oxygenase/reductase subunit PaaE [Thiomonas arsenitoxydans]CQR36892.1 subunit of the phenylacetly-CoA oxygenase/reductase [Thiomonas arsenitoxydans]CQR37985.1 subunit of the phenylacetly-CoA oxygenase/reductase [Thiomonas a